MMASHWPTTQETSAWREEHPQAGKGEEKGQSSPLDQAYPTGSRGGRRDNPPAPPTFLSFQEPWGEQNFNTGSRQVQNEKKRLQSSLLGSWMTPI